MQKLTRILTILERPDDCEVLLDKSVTLARCFGAEIELLLGDAVHARDFSKSIIALGYDRVKLTSLHRGEESLNDFILRRLSSSEPDLIIKAPAGAHPLRRWTLDANDWHLANECQTPVLLARHWAWSSPMRMAAAVDVADDDSEHLARGILHAAGMLAMGCEASLDVLYCEREKDEQALRMERTVKLAKLVREYYVGCERIQLFSGAPEKTLPPLVATRKYDVLVFGAQTRRQGFDGILGGMASRMFEATEGDVLLVKEPGHRYGEGRAKSRALSGENQRTGELEQFV